MKLLTDGQGKAVRWSVGGNTGQRPSRALEQLIRTMKLTCVLLTVAFLHVSAGSYSQQVTLSLKDAPIEKVFREIERQTGYGFLYNKQMFANFPNVSIDVKNADIKGVLNICFGTAPVEFVISDQTILIRPKEQPEKTGGSAEPPPGEIHGHITDSTGAPLSGASVSVKGNKRGTSTDWKGNFELKGVDPNSTLLVSYTGFESQEIKVNGKNEFAILLKQSTSQLDQTVVKGYYNTTDRLNTGDVTTVKSEDIEKQPVSDPLQALDGRVPGLYIQQTSGVPGSYATVRIQGQNSIANGNIPLYIVDGVPYGSVSPTSNFLTPGPLGNPASGDGLGTSPFNDLNPADIESIVVLKDADATAIYGSRGANGVILITTKKGKAGSTKLNLLGFSGAGKVAHFMDFMNTPQYLAMRHEALNNDGLTPGPSDYDVNGGWDSTRYTNWQKVLIGNPAKYTDLEGSLSGGNTNTQFRLAGGYSDQGTVYPGDFGDKKAMVSFDLTHASSNQRLHTELRTSYVYEYSNLPTSDLTQSINLAPDAPALYNSNGTLNWQLVNGSPSWINPLTYSVTTTYAKINNLIANLDISYIILPGLQVKSSFGYTHFENNQADLNPSIAFSPPNNNNPLYNSSTITTNDLSTWIIEPQLLYDKAIGKGKLNVLTGTTFQQNLQTGYGIKGTGYATDALINDPAAASSQRATGDVNTLYHYAAGFGRIGYDWDEKYLINITARRDGSSRFGPGKQFGNFGAIGMGWIFSQERFIQSSLPWLSFGKLRASYGTAGNDQIGNYQFLSTYIPYSQTYQNLGGLYPTSLTNPNFSWELVKKMEGGIQLGFLKDRILAGANYYRNRSGNQLVGYPLPDITGFGSVEANLPATVQNTGAEFTLTTVNIKSNRFSWRSSFNVTIPRNKLISYPNIQSSAYANTYTVGQSLFTNKEFAFAGVNDSTGSFQYMTSKGLSNNPQYPQDLYLTKPITQSFYGGLENTFSYAGFQFSFLVQFVDQMGANYLNQDGYQAGVFNTNYPTAILNHWKKPGDIAPYGMYSTLGQADPNYALSSSNFGLVNSSFIRLKNLSLAYQLTKKSLQKLGLEQARVYFQCQNLFTITHHFLGSDPETGGANVLPPLRILTAGLQIGL
jgi:TonB-linked SusC/RagA family outer membrane protein